jgi:hypothetical protein
MRRNRDSVIASRISSPRLTDELREVDLVRRLLKVVA